MPPKQTRKAARKVTKKPFVTQVHTRFVVDKLVRVTPEEARRTLLSTSVKESSSSTYESCRNTLLLVFTAIREQNDKPAPISLAEMTKEDFFVILFQLKSQGRASFEPLRSALLQYQRGEGIEQWCAHMDIRNAVKGASAGALHVNKGCVTAEMLTTFQLWIESSHPPLSCLTCDPANPLLWFGIAILAWLQFTCGLRPGQARTLQRSHLVTVGEAHSLLVHNKSAQVDKPQMLLKPICNDGASFFRSLCLLQLTSNRFVIPLCFERHLGYCLREASMILGWPAELAWVCHSLRVGHMVELTDQVTAAVTQCLSGITPTTFHRHYAIDNETRVKATRASRKKKDTGK